MKAKNIILILQTLICIGAICISGYTINMDKKLKTEYEETIETQNREINFLHERVSRLSTDDDIKSIKTRLMTIEYRMGIYKGDE